MVHNMNLNEKPFNNIKSKIKKVELRLFDEKRRNINLGDTIIFNKLGNTNETLKVQVKGLLRFNNFNDLFECIDYNISGPAESLEEKINNINKIYSNEKILKYGILAIYIELIED